jgi:phosphatidylserine decarboxylase
MATVKQRLMSLPFYVLPHHLISGIMFRIARIRWTPFKNLVIKTYTRLHAVDMTQAVIEDKFAYENLNAFFTRALKPACRPLDGDAGSWVCPVDGAVSQAGGIEQGRIFQAKGRDYSLLELLGGDQSLAALFHDGRFATLYLSPKDYHRIHMPCDATLSQMAYIPGRLFSVAEHTVSAIPRLFARNERCVCAFETDNGPMVMVLVGAINVAAIETVWHGLVTADKGSIRRIRYADDEIRLCRGDEMGRFNLGSTVIVIGPGNLIWHEAIQPGRSVRMGQAFTR